MTDQIADHATKTVLASKIQALLIPNMQRAGLSVWARPSDGPGNVAVTFSGGRRGEHPITVNASERMAAIKRSWAHMAGYIDNQVG